MKRKIDFILFFTIIFINNCSANKNNVCTSYEGYINITHHKDCYYDPIVDISDPIEIISTYIENVNSYEVTTEDGYTLKMFRLSQTGSPKGVVILMHPLSVDFAVWICGVKKSLPFRLWKAGFDVWMPNFRGTVHSQKHVNLNVTDRKYSEFSYHELGIYDLKEFIRFAAEKTGRNDIVYVGHSLSSMAAMVYSSELPEEAQKYIKLFILMTPSFKYQFNQPYILTLTRIVSSVIELYENNNIYGFYNRIDIKELLTFYPLNEIIVIIENMICGMNVDEFDLYNLVMPMCVSYGFSFNIWRHYFQNIRTRSFRKFDYGEEVNMKKYNQTEPPEYNIKNFRVPFFFFYGEKDVIALPKDTEMLYESLPDKLKSGKIFVEGLNHCDFQMGRHRFERVYDPIISIIKNLFK